MKTKYQIRFALNECSKRLKSAKERKTFSDRRITFEEGILFALSWALEDIDTTL